MPLKLSTLNFLLRPLLEMLSVLLSVLEGGVTLVETVTLDLGVFFDDDFVGPALEGGVTLETVTLDLGVFFDDDLGPAPDFFATGVLGAVL